MIEPSLSRGWKTTIAGVEEEEEEGRHFRCYHP